MKLRHAFFAGCLASVFFPTVAHAEPWSGVISPSRAIDWTKAGLPGGLPDAGWTQCGATIAPYDGASDTINKQIAGCGANQFVLLGPGTFHLTGTIDFAHKDHFALRGSGANATFLSFSNVAQGDCNLGTQTAIAICSTDKTDLWSNPPVFMWTDGLALGSTSITLSDTTGIAPGSLLFLTQDDDGYTGYPATGSSVDNGNYFVCADAYGNGPTGCAYNGPDGTYPSPFTHRWQYEIAVASSVNGKTVSIETPVRHPNWRASQVPTAMLVQPIVSAGVEDVSIDLGGQKDIGYAVDIGYCDGCWVSGVAVSHIYNWAIGSNWSTHVQLQSNYIYDGVGPDPYGFRLTTTADNAVVNNIVQTMRAPLVFDEPDVGTVIAYNFSVNSMDGSDAMFPTFIPHSAGDDFELYEGNVANTVQMDASHGTHLSETVFRNFFWGWESCANGNCGSTTAKDWGVTPVFWPAYMRYGNVVANVLGTPGFHQSYEDTVYGGCGGGKCAIFSLGGGDGAANPPIPDDPLVLSTMLRWANWDSVTNGTRFCGDAMSTGWATTCGSKSEVPAGAPVYPSTVPTLGDIAAGQGAMPASFAYASKPAWFGSVPWPPIGPDVQNGDIGQCTGTEDTPGQFAGLPATNALQCKGTTMAAAWGGHVNANPAMVCYLSLGGLLDGTGPMLAFDAKTCYGDGSSGGGSSSGGSGGSGSGSGSGGSSGASSSGGSSSGSGNGAAGGPSGSSGGCACRAGDGGTAGGIASLAALVGLAALVVRRKRAR